MSKITRLTTSKATFQKANTELEMQSFGIEGCEFLLEIQPRDTEKRKLKFEPEGEKLSGIWNLVRTHIEGK